MVIKQIFIPLLVILMQFKTFAQSNLWQYVGPKSNHYQYKGLFESVWADKENLNFVLAGSYCGGLFATNNALDEQPIWQNITDNLPYMNFGVSGIVVKPKTNKKTVYISTYTGGGLLTHGFGNGILYTNNGGLTWNEIGPKGKNNFEFPLAGLVSNEDNFSEMAAWYKKDFYVTQDAWKTYKKIELPFHKKADKVEICDVEFAPFENGKIYVATKTYLENKSQLFVSTDFGKSWADITPADVIYDRIEVATIYNPNYKGKYYIAYGNTDVYVRYFNGNNFSPILNGFFVNHIGAKTFWCFEMKVNNVDTSVIYLALTETSRSTDGGKTFKKIGIYNGPNTHADNRGMFLATSTPNGKEDKLYLANDGGISVSNDFESKKNVVFRSINGPGLDANQFWGIDVLQSENLFIAGGTQDNGGFFIKENSESNNIFACGDGYYGLTLNDTLAMVLGNPPSVLLHNTKTKKDQHIYINDKHCEARRPLIKKDSFVYIAYHDIWRANIKDLEKYKFNFIKVSDIPFKKTQQGSIQNREIKALAINKLNSALVAYTNPNWDAEKNEGKLYYCNNLLKEKNEFIDITMLNANAKYDLCRWWQVEWITADSYDKNKFYFIYKDPFSSSNSDVFQFTYYPDSNKANLKLITYNLNRVGFNKVKIDPQTNALYVASNDGVYYLNINNKDTVWKSLNFFPKVLVSDIVFNAYTNTIYASTFARGIWKSQIPNLNSAHLKFNKNTLISEPLKIDGSLKIKSRKKVTVINKLIICGDSKIQLGRKAVFILSKNTTVVNEKNIPINIHHYISKHKTAKVIIN